MYEHCVFDGTHQPLAAAPGMRDRTITLGSGGKLFSLTGWRVAWALGTAELVGPLGAAHTHLTFSAPTPLQAGVAAALDAEDGLAEIAPLFAENFQLLSDALEAMRFSGSEAPPVRGICAAQGGYFLVAETDGTPDVDWCKR